jgi:hypothetical protein
MSLGLLKMWKLLIKKSLVCLYFLISIYKSTSKVFFILHKFEWYEYHGLLKYLRIGIWILVGKCNLKITYHINDKM